MKGKIYKYDKASGKMEPLTDATMMPIAEFEIEEGIKLGIGVIGIPAPDPDVKFNEAERENLPQVLRKTDPICRGDGSTGLQSGPGTSSKVTRAIWHRRVKIHKVTDKLLHLTFDKASEAQELVTCERCGLSFNASNSTEEALAEFEREFPGEKAAALVCDSCYQKFMAELRASSLSN